MACSALATAGGGASARLAAAVECACWKPGLFGSKATRSTSTTTPTWACPPSGSFSYGYCSCSQEEESASVPTVGLLLKNLG